MLLELGVRLAAMGPRLYWRSNWHKLDAALSLAAAVDIATQVGRRVGRAGRPLRAGQWEQAAPWRRSSPCSPGCRALLRLPICRATHPTSLPPACPPQIVNAAAGTTVQLGAFRQVMQLARVLRMFRLLRHFKVRGGGRRRAG